MLFVLTTLSAQNALQLAIDLNIPESAFCQFMVREEPIGLLSIKPLNLCYNPFILSIKHHQGIF